MHWTEFPGKNQYWFIRLEKVQNNNKNSGVAVNEFKTNDGAKAQMTGWLWLLILRFKAI